MSLPARPNFRLLTQRHSLTNSLRALPPKCTRVATLARLPGPLISCPVGLSFSYPSRWPAACLILPSRPLPSRPHLQNTAPCCRPELLPRAKRGSRAAPLMPRREAQPLSRGCRSCCGCCCLRCCPCLCFRSCLCLSMCYSCTCLPLPTKPALGLGWPRPNGAAYGLMPGLAVVLRGRVLGYKCSRVLAPLLAVFAASYSASARAFFLIPWWLPALSPSPIHFSPLAPIPAFRPPARAVSTTPRCARLTRGSAAAKTRS